MTHRRMTAIEPRIPWPLIGIHDSLQFGELMDMSRQGVFIGMMDDPQSHLPRLAAKGADNRRAIISISTPAFALIGTTPWWG